MELELFTGLQKYFYSNLTVLKKFQGLQAEEILSFDLKDLLNLGLKEKDADFIVSKEILKEGEKELKRAEKENVSIISKYSSEFPSLLKEISYCPFVIWVKGEKNTLSKPCVSIVGTRNSTSYGRIVADSLSSELSKRGLVIVSGLARGIDTVVHSSAIGNGETIAVLGSGVDRIYPSENKRLASKIEKAGAIVSEFPLGTKALPYHFPMRNRIISGISYLTVVVEASEKSGALITAKWALEQNRDVLSVPGAITSKESKGTNLLIKQGAKPVLSWEDIWDEIPSFVKKNLSGKLEGGKPALSPEEERILLLIPYDSEINIDRLSLSSGLPVYEIFPILFQLEIKGLIVENPGKSYQRKIK